VLIRHKAGLLSGSNHSEGKEVTKGGKGPLILGARPNVKRAKKKRGFPMAPFGAQQSQKKGISRGEPRRGAAK